MDKSAVDKKVNEMLEWIKTQAHLPQKMEFNIVKLFLVSKKCDVEDAKSFLVYHLKFRLKHENLFFNRDPLDKAVQHELQVESILQMPSRTPENYKVFLMRLNDYDPDKVNFQINLKIFFIVSDIFAIHDEQDHDGEVVVYDMMGVTWRHLWRVSITNMRIFMKAIQDILPLRTKQIHIINATSLVGTLVGGVKPFMSSDFANMIHIHMADSETLFEHFPRDLMPEEYGGKAGKVSELQTYWINKIVENRDYLMDESRWRLKTK